MERFKSIMVKTPTLVLIPVVALVVAVVVVTPLQMILSLVKHEDRLQALEKMQCPPADQRELKEELKKAEADSNYYFGKAMTLEAQLKRLEEKQEKKAEQQPDQNKFGAQLLTLVELVGKQQKQLLWLQEELFTQQKELATLKDELDQEKKNRQGNFKFLSEQQFQLMNLSKELQQRLEKLEKGFVPPQPKEVKDK